MLQDGTPKPPDTKKPKKPTVRYVDLPIVACTPSMTKQELDRAHETEVCRDGSHDPEHPGVAMIAMPWVEFGRHV